MSEMMDSPGPQHQEVFQAICQEFGSAKFVGMLADCFGPEPTAEVLDRLGVSGALSGAALVTIYTNNRNNFKENYDE